MKNKPFIQEGNSKPINFDLEIIELISIALEPICINAFDNSQLQKLKSHPTTPYVLSTNPSKLLQEFQNQYQNESQTSPHQPFQSNLLSSHHYPYTPKSPSSEIQSKTHSLKITKKKPLENISKNENNQNLKDTFNSHASSNVTFSPLRIDISLPSLQSEEFESFWEEKDMINEIDKDIQVLLTKIKENQFKDNNSPIKNKSNKEKLKNQENKPSQHFGKYKKN